MKQTVYKFLSSTLTSLLLLIVYAVGLAVATFVEKHHGTETARAMFYYSPVFFLLQFLLVLNFIAVVIRHNYIKSKKWGMMIVHFSFIIIFLGALTSHLFGEEGIAHIREGEKTNQITIQTPEFTTYKTLPFTLELINFTMHRYPGSNSPSSYESDIRVHIDGETFDTKIFMNNVLDLKGYRFFQASYDKDEKGTILSVNQDVAGRNITYIGYALLILGFILSFTGKNSRFRQLNRQLTQLMNQKHAVSVLLLLISLSASAKGIDAKHQPLMNAIEKYAVDPAHAAAFGALPMQSSNGRMVPVNTFSSEILRKIHKNSTIGSLNADQFMLSLLALPQMWGTLPFIDIPNKEIVRKYDLTEGACAYAEFFDAEGNYKLTEMVDMVYNKKPNERSRFDKDLLKLDEQINILHQLFSRQMIRLFPLANDKNHTWYAPGDDLSKFAGKDSMFVSQIMEWYLSEVQQGMQSANWTKANEVVDMITTYQQAKNTNLDITEERLGKELKYNKLNVFRWAKIGYLILGGLLLILAFITLSKTNKAYQLLYWILAAGVLLVFHFHMYGMALRWYIGGYAPWSNSYETMVYVAWATVCAGLMFMRRSALTFALATLFAGIILFVSGLNWMDPQIGTLVPVLKSPWLMIHVAVIVAAYGFFGISFLIGILNLLMLTFGKSKKDESKLHLRIKELSAVNEMSLLAGLALMTIGTFLGAVWANESWGRYWGWDPKETWALITMVVYALVVHLRLVKQYNNVWIFNTASVVAFASVLMTYFGVNFFLSGMHSYGDNGSIGGIFVYLYAVAAVVVVLAIISYRGYKRTWK
jgi:cytochrome c-type biogenesis protein CcsB